MSGLKLIAISGTTSVTENLYIYEYGNDMIIVDCGVGFPEADMYGVDLIIPDFTYIKQNAHKLRGIFITHCHEDHIGALPFLFKDIKAPVYATKLTAGFIEDKFNDVGIQNFKVNVFNPEKDVIAVGQFKVTPFRVSHSVPDGVGYCIDTPEGKLFHIPDYKFDWTPVDGRPFDVQKLVGLAAGGALCLASDCVGATNPGYTESENEIEGRIKNLATEAKQRVFFTTISSNISRVKQALNVAQALGRKVAILGRSIDKKVQIAKKLGYITYPEDLVINTKRAEKMPSNKILYIVSGSYGQPGSALYRLALGEHERILVEPGDMFIFSADPAPPGSKANVDFAVDKLIELNTIVHYYDLQEDLHVSGHGSKKDIELLLALVKPKYYVPIGGTVRHMRSYSKIAQSMGALSNQVFELRPGEIVEFSNKNAKINGKVHVKDVLVDGLGIGDVGSVVLRDRQILAKDGVAIAILQFDRNEGRVVATPEIISRGFVFEDKNKTLLLDAQKALEQRLMNKSKLEARVVKDITAEFLERYFFEKIGRRPMVLPTIVEI